MNDLLAALRYLFARLFGGRSTLVYHLLLFSVCYIHARTSEDDAATCCLAPVAHAVSHHTDHYTNVDPVLRAHSGIVLRCAVA